MPRPPTDDLAQDLSAHLNADTDGETVGLVATDQADRPRIRVIRSAKRNRSSSARLVDGVIEVRIPAWFTDSQEADAVTRLSRRVRQKDAARDGADLAERAADLAREYDLPRPGGIRWVTNQSSRWGSCTIETGEIRISARLAKAPLWVLDAVLLHELTHLVEPGHTERFHELMARYPDLERADGFLSAMSSGHAHSTWTV